MVYPRSWIGHDGMPYHSRDEDRTLALYKEGSRVEARCRGSTEFWLAEIIRYRMNGTVDVLFDNGEKERGVNTSLIRGSITEVPCLRLG